MKERFKTSILLTVALVIASLVCPGSVLAQPSAHGNGKEQCYQFIVDVDKERPECKKLKSSMWVVEWQDGEKAPCDVKVWAKYGDNLTCQSVKTDDNQIRGQAFSDVKIKGPKDNTLSDAITTNSICNEMWLRFPDGKDCNLRCYRIGGRVYCR